MRVGDTSIGGCGRRFPETTWGILSKLRRPEGEDPRKTVEALALRYWKPVYLHLRIAAARSNEDAKDLTQAFFLYLLESDALRRYDPAEGGFRTFLKVVLRRFVGHHEEALGRLKRGGGSLILDLDALPLPDGVVDAQALTPEEAFDREWRRALVKTAIEAVRSEFTADGHASVFQVFEEHDLVGADLRPSYQALADRFGIKATDVRNRLFAVREAVRTRIRAELAELTSSEGEFEEEWNDLFG